MAADQILSPTTSSWEMLFDWIWSSVTMASIIETAAENFVSLQFGFCLYSWCFVIVVLTE